MNQVIQLNGVLNEVQNVELQVYFANTLLQLLEEFNNSIGSTSVVEFPEVVSVISPTEIESTLAFGLTQLNQTIFAESIVSTVAFGDDKQISMQIVYTNAIDTTVQFDNPELDFIIFANSILSEIEFGTSKLNRKIILETIDSTSVIEFPRVVSVISPTEIESTVAFGIKQLNTKIFPDSSVSNVSFEILQLNRKIFANAVNPSAMFGNLQTNMGIDNVPFPSIESTAIVSVPNVLKIIRPLSIAPTTSFGVSSFIDNIHRILIFKDDNISKIGENDATVIAGGIRLNPASVASETASSGDAILPEAPVGFLSVNINGVDYKIPYYNS
jgi:hypothetical protein